jgi:peptide-methionine (S)-S-oxide reductase
MKRMLAAVVVAGLALAFLLPDGANAQKATPPAPAGFAKAIFAGGCFWCMEQPFDVLDGVRSTTSGYIGGTVANPTYEQVSGGRTGHTEAVEIVFDPSKVTYEKLLDTYWRNVDPTDKGGQFCDRGSMYRPEIFVTDAEQRKAAEASKAALEKSKPFREAIVVPITQATTFYAAEDYHQDFYKTNPVRYKFYRNGCGRDARLERLWGKAPH